MFFHTDPGLVFPLIAVSMNFIGFVVVMCVISEAAGKPVERQKGKAVVIQTGRWKDSVLHASAMHHNVVRFHCLECNLFSEDSRVERKVTAVD